MEPLSENECQSKLVTLLERITSTSKDTAFVLHIDEAQSWYIPFSFARKCDNEVVNTGDCEHYIFIAFNEALETLCSSCAVLQVFITGTNMLVERFLRPTSNVNHFLITVRESN